MATFSERHGLKLKKTIQLVDIDDDLKNGLWTALDLFCWMKRKQNMSGMLRIGDPIDDETLEAIVAAVWIKLLKLPLDLMPNEWRDLKGQLRIRYFKFQWHEIYTFLEFIAPRLESLERGNERRFVEYCNQVLKEEVSAWRFIRGYIVPISNEIEVQTIETAMSTPHEVVNKQFKTALASLSQKPEPDKRNCIKEAISAVESLVRKILAVESGTLGELIPDLQTELNLHEKYKETLRNFWLWTCDVARHGEKDNDNLSVDDAKFGLVISSGFANHLLQCAQQNES